MVKLAATTYEGLEAFLANREQRTIGHNTTARRSGPAIIVRYHATDILTLTPDGSVVVNSGGYHTPTTKDRINQFLPFGIGVIQEDWVWYFVRWGGDEGRTLTPYEDHATIGPDGSITYRDGGEM